MIDADPAASIAPGLLPATWVGFTAQRPASTRLPASFRECRKRRIRRRFRAQIVRKTRDMGPYSFALRQDSTSSPETKLLQAPVIACA